MLTIKWKDKTAGWTCSLFIFFLYLPVILKAQRNHPKEVYVYIESIETYTKLTGISFVLEKHGSDLFFCILDHILYQKQICTFMIIKVTFK